MTSTKRLTGRQIIAMVAMLSAALVLAPGALTVDGKVQVSGGSVGVTGNVHAYAPTATWHFTNTYSASLYDLTLPRADAANLTSLFAGGDSTTQFVFVVIYAKTVPKSATTCSDSAGTTEVIWQGQTGGSAGATIPISITFPSPLTSRPASGKKTCLYAYLNHSGGSAIMNASGYYGG